MTNPSPIATVPVTITDDDIRPDRVVHQMVVTGYEAVCAGAFLPATLFFFKADGVGVMSLPTDRPPYDYLSGLVDAKALQSNPQIVEFTTDLEAIAFISDVNMAPPAFDADGNPVLPSDNPAMYEAIHAQRVTADGAVRTMMVLYSRDAEGNPYYLTPEAPVQELIVDNKENGVQVAGRITEALYDLIGYIPSHAAALMSEEQLWDAARKTQDFTVRIDTEEEEGK